MDVLILQWEVVLYHLNHANSSTRQTAAACGVCPSSVSNYVKRYREGILGPKPHRGGRKPKLDEADLCFLRQHLSSNPMLCLDEMANLLQTRDSNPKSVSISTISKFLKKHGITRKKVSVVPKERMKPHVVQRTQEFESMMTSDPRFHASNLVFLDESNINNRTCWRRFGWSASGQPVVVNRKYVKQKGIGLLAALCGKRRGGIVAHTLQEGSYNRESFLHFLEYSLLPKMRGRILIMDNCSIHKGNAVKALCDRFDVTIEFLPAYSPHLNPIELMFSKLKYVLRRNFDRQDICTPEAIEMAIGTVTDKDSIGWTRKCNYRMDIVL